MTPALLFWLQLVGLLGMEITMLAGLAMGLQRFTQSAAWRRIVWQVCVVAALVLALGEFSGIARFVPAGRGTGRAVTPGQTEVAEKVRPQPARQVAAPPDATPTDPVIGPVVSALSMHAEVQPKPTSISAHVTAFDVVPGQPHHPLADTLANFGLGILWITGAAFVLGRGLLGRMVFLLLRHKWRPVADPGLQTQVFALARRMGIRSPIGLIESRNFTSPLAFGFIRPTIGLPLHFLARFSAVQREAMLLHELAHLWSRDPVWHWLADWAAALLWWHPLAWWIRRQLHVASEMAADEASLLVANGPEVLAECLVALGGQLRPRLPFGTLGMGGSGFRSGLGRRVERLLRLGEGDWTPLCPRRAALARFLGPVALTAIVLICTAWAVPTALTKGENMNTMKQTWQRTLSALTLSTALVTGLPDALGADPGRQSLPAPPDQTPPRLPESVLPPVANPAVPAEVPAPEAPGSAPNTAFGRRYGLPQAMPAQSVRLPLHRPEKPNAPVSNERRALEARLEMITLDQVRYDGLPLTEVIRDLMEISTKRDPDSIGINFVLDREPAPPTPGMVDPATGLPVVAEQADLRAVTIKLDPALKHVRLLDVLNVLVKVADQPIKYSVTDYGVVFSFDRERRPALPEPVSLSVCTYKVDTNNFFAGLQSAFGIRLEGEIHSAEAARVALRAMLQKLSVDLDAPNKSVFYNDLTGILMVRVSNDDQVVVRAAIETLGGSRLSAMGNEVIWGGRPPSHRSPPHR